MSQELKDKIKSSIAGAIVFLLIIIAIFIIVKYNEEGEGNMPFEISKIVIGSMVVSSDDNINIDATENEIIQNNGVYIELQKNSNYKKEAIIEKVEIGNIKLIKEPKKGNIKYYMPNTIENQKFSYIKEYVIEGESLTYNGASKSDTTLLEINNQGGIVAISFANEGLGSYSLSEEETRIDGTLLKKLGIDNEEIEFTVEFDLTIFTNSKKFKSNIKLDLPPSDITESGKSSIEITDTNKFVFKRIVE